MGLENMTIEQLFAQFPRSELNAAFIGLLIGSLFLAFFGFRFLKLEIVLSAVVAGYEFGADKLGLAIGDAGLGFNLPVILGIACALIFGLLSFKFYKLYIYLVGGAIGAALGFVIPFALIENVVISIIVGVILAIVLAILGAKLFYKFFKPIYIFSSSFAGSIMAATYLSLLIFGANESMLGGFIIGGFVLTVVAMIFQFRLNKDRELDL